MVDGIKGFRQINKNTYSRDFFVQGVINSLSKMDNGHVSRMFRPKAELIAVKDIVASQVAIKTVINKSFKNLGKIWKNGDRSIIGEKMRIIFFVDGYDFSNFKFARNNTGLKGHVYDVGQRMGN